MTAIDDRPVERETDAVRDDSVQVADELGPQGSRILHTVVLFVPAAVLAFALSGPVHMLSHRLGNRPLAIVVTYLLVGVLVVGGITVITGPFVRPGD